MAILEEEIFINLNGTTVKYFYELGYEIPKFINTRGKLIFDSNKKLLIKVKDLQKNSNIQVTKVCDICGKKNKLNYAAILNTRRNGKDFCVSCGTRYAKQLFKENIPYEKTLEYFAKNNNMEYLLKEFSDKNAKKPNEIFPSTKEKYYWNCLDCKNEFYLSTNERTSKGINCHYCSGKKVLKGFNDLWTTHPEVARLLRNPELGYEISYGSKRKEEFKCNDCGSTGFKIVGNVVKQGFTCLCSDGVSYPEKFMMSVLNQSGVIYEKSKLWKWSKNKIYDFYIPSLNCIIETHGGQHYSHTGFNRTLEEEKNNDIVKEKLAKENGIEHYIVIDCRKSELNFIKNNITKSILSNFIDLTSINWFTCHEYACSNLIKTVCDLWSQGKKIKEIEKIIKLSRITIVRHLKQGMVLKWCDYDPQKSLKETYYNTKKKFSKKVIQLTIDGEYIKEWDSVRDASRTLNIDNGNISRVTNGKQNSAGGYKWIYKVDYEKSEGA